MKTTRYSRSFALLAGTAIVALSLAGSANAAVKVQCGPQDRRGNNIYDVNNDAVPDAGSGAPQSLKCQHVTGSDGFMSTGDGKRFFIFNFHDVTGVEADNPADDLLNRALLSAEAPNRPIQLDQDDEFYLNLTNVGMVVRPDLFDPHTIHYHGFPEAGSIFDGVPEMSLSVNQEATLTYYYRNVHPGTYMWHCHVEATEHMQMGMLNSLWVRPAQNRLPDGTVLTGGHVHSNPDENAPYDDALVGDKYVYNDGDAGTYYDVEYPVQVSSIDPVFHSSSEGVQPLPFADMRDTYAMFNGRGYPDTVVTAQYIPPFRGGNPATDGDVQPGAISNQNDWPLDPAYANERTYTQNVSSKIEATAGQKILLRIVNLSVTRAFSLQLGGLKMRIVGRDSRILRGYGEATGTDLSYLTSTYRIHGGETMEAIIDTTDVPTGTYALYTSNLNYLSNDTEDYGGLMTEIEISAP